MFALTAILLPHLVLAQLSITGRVTDGLNQQILAGASIKVGDYATQSDSEGQFSIQNIKEGNYLLKVSYLGYRTYNKTIKISTNENLAVALERNIVVTDEVIVSSTRANKNSATTYRNIDKEEFEKNNLGQDLPYLLNQTPSVVVTSDAGAGIGYTGIRIRGSDATRVNVTLNGIPYNDSESQGNFYVNLPDIASSVDNIQIQRGVGTSTNGAGAFGGSLNIQTTTLRDSAYAELNNSAGSFGTLKNTVLLGTGLINNKFTFDGRLSRIKSDGYIDRGSSDLKSYFLSGAYYGKNDLLRVNIFSGTEKTYQSWTGITADMLKTNRTYNAFTYDDQTDNYTQDHYQALYSHSFSNKLSLNTALHYTYGRGYYEEFKDDQKLTNYGIEPDVIGGTSILRSDLIRRRWLDNDFYGLTYSLNYKAQTNLDFTLGGAYNEYDGDHFGEVIWSKYASDSKIRHRYYDGNGFKTDFNIYGRANYQFNKFNLFADLQYRAIDYTISGTDKNRMDLDQSDNLNFFNPKAGITYQINNQSSVYTSFAVANKEPNRDDYVNSTEQTRPNSENLKNVEAGYRLNTPKYTIGLNAYGMFYKDQLVLTGAVNDVGESIRQNVDKSYRIGLELDGKWKISDSFSWNATASLSDNKIDRFTEVIYYYDADFNPTGQQQDNVYKDTEIAYSPSLITSSELAYKPFKNTEIAFLSKYISKQYMDNTGDNERSLPAYDVHDVRLRYVTSFKQIKNIGISLLINNVFSEKYVSNGYTYSYFFDNDFTTESYYFPQAYRNFLVSLSLKF